MGEILMQAFSFVAIIILGYVLRSRGFFKEEDFYVISRIVLKITLPAAIVSNFSGMSLEPSMLLISLLGLGGGVILIGTAWLISAGKSKEESAFSILNMSGYNIEILQCRLCRVFLDQRGLWQQVCLIRGIPLSVLEVHTALLLWQRGKAVDLRSGRFLRRC